MKLFPHVLVRISGGSLTRIHELECTDTFCTITEVIVQKQQLESIRTIVCDTIYKVIPLLAEPSAQTLLINLRRDIFNDRKINSDKWEQLAKQLDQSLVAEISEYMQCKAALIEKIDHCEKTYESELSGSRKKFRELVQNEEFQKGLILSSQVLLDQIRTYISKDVNSLRKKEIQTERGLIRYITRMYTKTSPFSTFTNLAMAEVNASENTSKALHFSETQAYQTKSHIRINNYLLAYLKGLFGKSPEIYRHFHLRPNPTIYENQTGYTFLTNNNNKEAFQRFPSNQVVGLLHELSIENKEGIMYKTLVEEAKESIDASNEQIEGYINQLINYGFFEFNIGVSGTDPDWDLKLNHKLEALKSFNPLIGQLILALEDLRGMAESYAESGVQQRKQILTDAYQLFRDVCMKIHEAAGLPAEERKPREQIIEEYNLRQQGIKKQIDLKIKEEKKKKYAENENPAEEKTEPIVAKEIKPLPGEVKEDTQPEEKKEEAFKHLTSTYFSFKPEQMFYEDTSLEMSSSINEKELDEFTGKADRLFNELNLFRVTIDEDEKMKHFFTNKYGESSASILQFYEDYFKEFKQPEADYHAKVKKEMFDNAIKAHQDKNKKEEEKVGEKTDKVEDKPLIVTPTIAEPAPDFLQIPSLKIQQEKTNSWLIKFNEKLRSVSFDDPSQIYHLSLDWLSEINQAIGIEIPKEELTSKGVFVQFFKENPNDSKQQLQGVLNNVIPGFSKLTSRFLHIFDSSVYKEALSWNQSLIRDSLFIEDCDASYFNANLHPPLMPFEIWMPGSNNTLPTDQQISVTDLEVKYMKETDKLQLFHKPTGKEAFVFDLGFQALGGRSQLFQLLSRFTLIDQSYYHAILNSVNGIYYERNKKQEDIPAGTERKRELIKVPRIIFDDQVIIQRKGWFVPKEMLPIRQNEESDFKYFQRVNEWRIALGIPEEVFINITSREELQNLPFQVKMNLKLGRDEYKPQYISFRNPFLVNLFEKLLEKVPTTLRIDEMLPASEKLATVHGNAHTTECVVQWFKGSNTLINTPPIYSEAVES